mmetsp:Transcript_120335/g.190662  ORF Transcript_120335/g.190662 Transcript_120335/m.190662 type:complete len:408 (-) Transcript_120335:341-1564(-)
MAAGIQMVLNVGSSSIKYALYRSAPVAAGVSFTRLAEGLAEGIGTNMNNRIKHVCPVAGKSTHNIELRDHAVALTSIVNLLPKEHMERVASVGHRVVHGGEKFTKASIINDEVMADIEEAIALAPLHNPFSLLGIKESAKIFGEKTPQVAVFDTAFHQTMEPHVYLYALPKELYEKHGIRRYGFHGTSYMYVLGQVAEAMGKPVDQTSIIACHIGNGASMCAIKNGKCVDTTMGLTPLEGLVMGTRCGDIDPAIIPHLVQRLGYPLNEVSDMINKKAGLLGLCGTSDDRDIEERAIAKEPIGLLAKKIQVHRMRKYLGAYMVALDGKVDAVVFAGGMAEKSALLRTMLCENLEGIGFHVDEKKNHCDGGRFSENTPIHAEGSGSQIWVIPTDEELCIAQQAYDLCHT